MSMLISYKLFLSDWFQKTIMILMDYILTSHSLIELLKIKKKERENFSCFFVDFERAFDSVWRWGLWNKHNKRPKGPHFVHLSTMCHLF